MRKHFPSEIILRSLLLGLSICFASASEENVLWAQDASKDPHITAEVPQTAPSGVSQEDWDKESEHCKKIGAEMERRQRLPPDQLHGLPNIHDDWENCARRVVPVQNQYWPPRPIYKNTIPPVAMPTATPPLNPLNNTSTAPAATSAMPIKGNPVPLGLVHLR